MALTTTPISEKDYVAAQHEPGVEFVNGELREKEMSEYSTSIAVVISALLHNANRSKQCRVYSEMGYRCFGDDPTRFRKPDVSAVRMSRLLGLDRNVGLHDFPPDLAVEIVSPNDIAYDVDLKVNDYINNGFALVWVVYPSSKTIVQYAGKQIKTFQATDELTLPELLPEFKCKVIELFE
jgi:Uma2 family endonuclease